MFYSLVIAGGGVCERVGGGEVGMLVTFMGPAARELGIGRIRTLLNCLYSYSYSYL